MDGSDAQAAWTPREVGEGEWAGWRLWSGDPFERLAGPFYSRREPDETMVCAFRAEEKHMNGAGFMHGGCLLTFADFALFCFAEQAIAGVRSVTASLNAEFVDAARIGELIEARGEVIRDARSMVFVRGLLTAAERPLMSFSGIIKKTRPRP